MNLTKKIIKYEKNIKTYLSRWFSPSNAEDFEFFAVYPLHFKKIMLQYTHYDINRSGV